MDWSGRVGTYTFDQAVMELGPPYKQGTLTDGTRVADWMTRRGGVRRMVIGGYDYSPYYHGAAGPAYMDYSRPDYFLRLMFASDGQLKEWSRFAR